MVLITKYSESAKRRLTKSERNNDDEIYKQKMLLEGTQSHGLKNITPDLFKLKNNPSPIPKNKNPPTAPI